MPIYEYKCQQCESEMEILVRTSEQPSCTYCGSDQLEKAWSVPAAHTSGGMDLPVCRPNPTSGCGLPQCGTGGCHFDS